MKKTTLAVMAAGIGSRFGKGIKQLEPVGPSGQIIMDYSIHDALEAGFNKVVFIIRKDLEADFREIIGRRIEKQVEVEYAFQELQDLPKDFTCPEGRTKPWGTGQAILSTKEVIHEPFVEGGVGGSSDSIRRTAETLLRNKREAIELLAADTGKSAAEVEKAISYDHYMTAKEAIAFGICDKIIKDFV